MRRLPHALLVLAACTLGCNKGSDDTDELVLEVTATDGTWAVDVAADGYETMPIVAVIPNVDDDDQDGAADWTQGLPDGDNDTSPFIVHMPGHAVKLTLSQSAGTVRLWKDGSVVLNPDVTELTLSKGKHDVELQVEADDYLAEATLTVKDQATGQEMTVLLKGAPLILNHHLQPSELVTAMNVNSQWGDNQDMVAGYEEALGDLFVSVKQNAYDGDVWVQDEIEFATLTAGDARMDFVIDSIRNGQGRSGDGLDDLAEDEFEGPDFALGEWGNGTANSQDSFGNLEISPPVTVDGVEYPFGRIYWGSNGGRMAPTAGLTNFLESQKVQAPFEVDSTWLCVGHVDEYSTFVPDSTAPKGFRFLWSDTTLGWDVLESMDESDAISRYSSGHGYSTVGELVNDNHLRNYNEDVQDILDGQLEEFKVELGLTDEDITLVPGLFEEVSWCGNTGVAIVPGMANLIVADDKNGDTTLFVPDPWVRRSNTSADDDPMAQDFASRMPDELNVVFLDDWDVYHLGMGEVHCGSNVIRTPAENAWWTDARHLLE
ncbi:MAG: hypothetical protein GY913_19895 [Proteobacteria bacterium]|nr:hypothetical protein [Pseudomonadota bacterium]MCP4919172.1 hypothetical protein [Pseudomonadota bacterium]